MRAELEGERATQEAERCALLRMKVHTLQAALAAAEHAAVEAAAGAEDDGYFELLECRRDLEALQEENERLKRHLAAARGAASATAAPRFSTARPRLPPDSHTGHGPIRHRRSVHPGAVLPSSVAAAPSQLWEGSDDGASFQHRAAASEGPLARSISQAESEWHSRAAPGPGDPSADPCDAWDLEGEGRTRQGTGQPRPSAAEGAASFRPFWAGTFAMRTAQGRHGGE